MRITRRNCLKWSLGAPASPLLASLATGLPLAWILGEREVRGAPTGETQFLVLNLSGAGDPINAGTPGVVGAPGVHLNPQPSMAPTRTTFGGSATTAAAPWATLPEWVRQRTAFVHHRTYTNSHPNFFKVLGLFGASKSKDGNAQEQVQSLYSSELADSLQTVQREPVILSVVGARVLFEGREQPMVLPSSLSAMFSNAKNETLEELQTLREQHLDSIYQSLSATGTPAQKEFLDRYANTRQQLGEVRTRVGNLVGANTTWNNNGEGQAQAAATLIQLGIAPVVVVHIPFGGDNHTDTGLQIEALETNSGVAAIGTLMQLLESAGLQNNVTFATFNVFGRTLGETRGGNGRNHNQNHHTSVLIGPKIRGGVAGGVEPFGTDFGASGMDSVSGAASAQGDIQPEESLESLTLTVGCSLGLSEELLKQRVVGGKVIKSVLA